jgi:hypothetical protein
VRIVVAAGVAVVALALPASLALGDDSTPPPPPATTTTTEAPEPDKVETPPTTSPYGTEAEIEIALDEAGNIVPARP